MPRLNPRSRREGERRVPRGESMSYWIKRIADAVAAVNKEPWLESIFEAEGCREGWMQGELYLRHATADGLKVNSLRIGHRAKADLSAHLGVDSNTGGIVRQGVNPMIGEIKMLRSTFLPKNITGRARTLKDFGALPLRRGRRCVDLAFANRHGGAWGLVPDFMRLRAAHVPRGTERLLVLVAHTGAEEPSAVGSALKEITFDASSEVTRRLGDWGFVRVWSL
jgi:hypothetical protein